MKTCSKCKIVQNMSEFPPRKDRGNKPHSWCRTCLQKRVDAVLRNRSKKKEFVDAHKREHGCAVCGITEPVVLDYHHLGDKVKVATVSTLIANHRSFEALREEIEKCVLLCANHHRMVTAGLLEV